MTANGELPVQKFDWSRLLGTDRRWEFPGGAYRAQNGAGYTRYCYLKRLLQRSAESNGWSGRRWHHRKNQGAGKQRKNQVLGSSIQWWLCKPVCRQWIAWLENFEVISWTNHLQCNEESNRECIPRFMKQWTRVGKMEKSNLQPDKWYHQGKPGSGSGSGNLSDPWLVTTMAKNAIGMGLAATFVLLWLQTL